MEGLIFGMLRYVFCIQFTCEGLYLSLALRPSYCTRGGRKILAQCKLLSLGRLLTSNRDVQRDKNGAGRSMGNHNNEGQPFRLALLRADNL